MKHPTTRTLAVLALLGGTLLVPQRAPAEKPTDVAATPHNLSVSGPGPIKAVRETQICVFCHTPHNADPRTRALWNRELPPTPFIRYTSGRLDAAASGGVPQPDGSSKLCLSCHDGTLALGAVLSRKKPIELRGTSGGRMPRQSRGYVGRDLSGMHPISFAVNERLIARNNTKDSMLVSLPEMRSDPDVHLDATDKLQCTTCHDAHDDSNFGSSGIHFYNKPELSDVCDVCHRL